MNQDPGDNNVTLNVDHNTILCLSAILIKLKLVSFYKYLLISLANAVMQRDMYGKTQKKKTWRERTVEKCFIEIQMFKVRMLQNLSLDKDWCGVNWSFCF